MRRLTGTEVKQTLDVYASCGENAARAAAQLGISASTFKDRLRAARLEYTREAAVDPGPVTPAPAPVVPDRAQEELFELRAQLKSVRANSIDDEYVKRKIIGLSADMSATQPPPWVAAKPDAPRLPGVPTAFWSDWHWGEVVYKKQVNGVNEFNLEIAHARAKLLVEKTVYLLRHHIVNPTYPGIVLGLGGDMFSGDIHDELSQTNEIPLLPAHLDLFGVLVWAINVLADEFGSVFIPCVTGNHGRNTRKPQAKNRNFTNFDWLLYQYLAKHFENDQRVTFYIPDGSDAYYRVYGHRYLMTHGDQFRGGDGIIGHLGPVTRGRQKKAARNSNVGQPFDTMLHGHFHTYSPTMSIVGNGSLKGYDEYAAANNFGYEPPIQALFLTHYEHGITQHLPVYLEAHAGRERTTDWVSVPR